MLRHIRHVIRILASQKGPFAAIAAGVAIGVTVLTVVVSVNEGTKLRLHRVTSGFGPRSTMFIAAKSPSGASSSWTIADLNALRVRMQDRAIVSTYVMQKNTRIVSGSTSITTTVYGMDYAMHALEQRQAESGLPIDREDMARNARVCVLGGTVSRLLFADANPVGEQIMLSGTPFQVKGVLESRDVTVNGLDLDNVIWIPLTTGMRLFDRSNLKVIRVRSIEGVDPKAVTTSVTTFLRDRHRLRAADGDDFRSITSEESTEKSDAVVRTATRTGWVVTLIAFGVGMLLTINVLFLSVHQRRAEIGLKRAFGARRRDIVVEVMLFSLFVALAGMIVGIAAGLVCVALVPRLLPDVSAIVTWWPIAYAIPLTIAAAVIAALTPAQRAAAVQPSVALRA